MSWIVLAVCACVACELFLRMPLRRETQLLLLDGDAARRVLLSRTLSDRWKERLSVIYTRRVARHTAMLAAWFALFGVAVAVLGWIAHLVLPDSAMLMATWRGITFGSVVALCYSFVRMRKVMA